MLDETDCLKSFFHFRRSIREWDFEIEKMNAEKIAMLLGATVGADRDQAQSAEKELDSMQKILGFPGLILQIVMNKSVDPAVRQSGAIYLKNFCQHFWMEREVVGPDGDSLSNFAIHETDKKVIPSYYVTKT